MCKIMPLIWINAYMTGVPNKVDSVYHNALLTFFKKYLLGIEQTMNEHC